MNTQYRRERTVLTIDLARGFLSTLKLRRPEKKAKLMQFCSDIESGKWIPMHQAMAIDENGCLIDGMHRCMAVIRAGKPIIVEIVYGVPSETFKVIDTGTSRSAFDTIFAEGFKNNGALISASAKHIINFKRGHSFLSTYAVTNTDVSNFVALDELLRQAAIKYKKPSKLRLLSPSAVVSFFYLSSEIHSLKAEEFAIQLQTGANLDFRSPVLRLRNNLNTGKYSTTKMLGKAMVVAWRYFKEGKVITRLDVSENDGFDL